MTKLAQEIAEAEARLAYLNRLAHAATCRELGHDWKSDGGRNAGCEIGGRCSCSVPVSSCARCGDSDYGDTPEGERIMAECRAERADMALEE